MKEYYYFQLEDRTRDQTSDPLLYCLQPPGKVVVLTQPNRGEKNVISSGILNFLKKKVT